MKKLFTIFALALVTLSISAQDFKKFRFGPVAGINVAKVTNTDMRMGFNAGVRAEYNITDNYYLGSALMFTQKGYRDDWAVTDGTNIYAAKLNANPGYIEIPINAGYRYTFSNKLSLFAEFGPYFAYGVCGKYSNSYLEGSADFFGDEGTAFATSMLFANLIGEVNPNRFECGLGVIAGLEYANVQLRLGYEFGLTKVYSAGLKSKTLTISAAYLF
jgi:opacity protein-like surface antigen